LTTEVKMNGPGEKGGPSFAGGLAPCQIFIDQQGDWYHKGNLMFRQDIVSLLCEHLRRDEASGLFIIRLGGQECYLEVEDTPVVITRVEGETKKDGKGLEEILLFVKHLEEPQVLDPTTLWQGKDNVLYCKVFPQRLPARFLRPAYYQLARFVEEDSQQGKFYLNVAGSRYYIGRS